MILECGLGPYIGLPENPDVQSLKKVWISASKGNTRIDIIAEILFKWENYRGPPIVIFIEVMLFSFKTAELRQKYNLLHYLQLYFKQPRK